MEFSSVLVCNISDACFLQVQQRRCVGHMECSHFGRSCKTFFMLVQGMIGSGSLVVC